MSRMPVLFVGHGSPMNALANNAFTQKLTELGKTLPRPQAILCVSAHWETQGTKILDNETPPTIHDFFGFPKPLFDLEYPAKGSHTVAEATHKLIPRSTLTEEWGLDHGTWSVLVHMYPQADIPVFQLSLDTNKTAEQHLEIGKLLKPLREQGVLIVGSGNIVHNLRRINWNEPNAGYDWAFAFDGHVKSALEQRDDKSLTQFKDFGEAALKSVPTPEHYLPLLYCYGASDEKDHISYPYEGFEMGSLSMRNVLWG